LPLAWYDALLELYRAVGRSVPWGGKADADPQYSTSRLIDRLVDEGWQRGAGKIDKRGQFVKITEAGRGLPEEDVGAYSAAIEKHVGAKLSDTDALRLCGLLDRLGCSCDGAPSSAAETALGTMILFHQTASDRSVADAPSPPRSVETPHPDFYGA
jgi:hypothetical protein